MYNKRAGAIGALLDIYEYETDKLIVFLSSIEDNLLSAVLDPHTNDPNCRSIQSILTHVVHAGFGYAVSIRRLRSANEQRPDPKSHPTVEAYILAIRRMFMYTKNTLHLFSDTELRIIENKDKIMTGWQQVYDPEQLMEHAIVHIVRHHRQMERLLSKVRPT